jgi:RNA polymerase sigma factor (sigma-70 family)
MLIEDKSGRTPRSDAWFRTTHWTVVLEAAQRDSAQADGALARLCETYWYPLYTYIRRLGHSPEDAQDLTQEFFARFVEKDFLKSLVQEKGKFRTFLLMTLTRFLANERDRANRLKRGGGRQIISLDAQDTESRYRAEPVDDMSPEKAFERRWAMTVVDKVMAQLGVEFSERGQAELFGQLRSLLGGEGGQCTYAEVAEKFGMTVANVKVTVYRLRSRFRELLRQEIAHTVSSPEEIDDEVRYLFATLS